MASRAEKFTEDRQLKWYLKNILRKVFLEDWLMKLVALLITFALWVGVTGLSQPQTQQMSGIPLTLRFPNDVDVSSDVQEISLSITGDKRKIDLLNRNDLVVSLDLTNIPPGEQRIQLTPSTVSIALPTGLKVTEIQPRLISVKIEPVEIKEVQVTAVTVGQPAEGFEVYGQTISPPKIRVRGPANLTRSLASVSTDKIDLTSRNADFTARQVSVNVASPKATLLETLVDVTFRVGEKRIEKTFSVTAADDSNRKENVVLYGGRSLLEGLKPEDITVEFVKDASGVERPSVTLPSELAGNVEIRRPRPDR